MSVIAPAWVPGMLGALILAIMVAMCVRWVRLPYTLALVLVGLLIGLIGPWLPTGETFQGMLSAEIILYLMLPPLLFQGAATMDLNKLLRNWRSITLLAVPGVLISSVVIGVIAWQLVWPDHPDGLLYGLLLGSILAATDPVSVLALFKTLGAPKRLTVLIEGESLFNDGTAVVLFNILLFAVLASMAGEGLSNTELLVSGLSQFIMVISVGFLVGLVGGVMANWVLMRTDDHLVEISITVALAFGTFLLAELLNGSGVIAVVIGGLLVGNHGTRFGMTATARVGLHHFWEVVTFLINGVLFLLIGYEIQSSLDFTADEFQLAAIAIFAALVARLVIYPLIALGNRGQKNPISMPWRHTVFWSGLRGSIPIALLLLLSNMTLHAGAADQKFDAELYNQLLVMSFSVVLWTLLVQGLTLKPLMNTLGMGGTPSESERAYEVALAETLGARAALSRLEGLHGSGLLSDLDRDRMTSIYLHRLQVAEEGMAHHAESSDIHASRVETARREVLMAQMSTIREAERGGLLSTHVAHEALRTLDDEFHLSELKQEEKHSELTELADQEAEQSPKILPDAEPDLPPTSFAMMVPPETEEILDSEESSEE